VPIHNGSIRLFLGFDLSIPILVPKKKASTQRAKIALEKN